MTPTPSDPAQRSTPKRLRRLVDAPALAGQAVALLCSPDALFTMTIDDARCIVGYMSLLSYAKGATLLREGDPRDGKPGPDANELLLILEGQVSVDLGLESRSGGVAIASLNAIKPTPCSRTSERRSAAASGASTAPGAFHRIVPCSGRPSRSSRW